MIIIDKAYGKFTINDPIILALLKSPSVQRLKKIDQAGYFEPFFPNSKHTRYEHSVGVYLLLKKFKAPLAEQVAGLIHDVSHSAFSHCIDYALAQGSPSKHSHQDNIFKNYVLKKTDIPNILKKFGFNPEYILNEENFPLKERTLPDICADRLDYSLRTAIMYRVISRQKVKYFLNNLTTKNNLWVFKNQRSAKEYANLYGLLNTKFYSGLSSAVMFFTTGQFLKHGLVRKYINSKDLYTTDGQVLKKLEKYLEKDQILNTWFLRMNNKIKFKNDKNDFQYKAVVKSRAVDPYCFFKKRLTRLSKIYPHWKKVIKEESKPKVYYLQFNN